MDGKMKEQIHIITKFCLISFMAFFVFVSCKTKQKEEFLINQYQNYDMKKKEKLNTFNIDETVYEFYQTGDISIFEKYLGYNVERENIEEIDSSLLPISTFEDVCIRKNLFLKENWIIKKDLIIPICINHPSKGRLVLLIYNYFKKTKKGFFKRKFVCRIFKGYAYLSCPEGCYLQEDYPAFKEENWGTYYERERRKVAFVALDRTKPRPCYTKLRPLYMVYEENDKLVVEEPKDDKYYMWLEEWPID